MMRLPFLLSIRYGAKPDPRPHSAGGWRLRQGLCLRDRHRHEPFADLAIASAGVPIDDRKFLRGAIISKYARAFLMVLIPLASLPSVARAETACRVEIGARKAGELVKQCLEVSPATRPPCNAVNSCELIVSEIIRGCELLEAADRPRFCSQASAPGTGIAK